MNNVFTFKLQEVDSQELTSALLHYFGQSQGVGELTHKYQKKDSTHHLIVKFNRDGKISQVELSEKFPKEELKQLNHALNENLLKNQKEEIGQTIGFSHDKVGGYFKYKDLFQILPVPPDAPKAGVMVADNPFLLQFKYISSPDMMIDNSRRRQKAYIYTRLLNLLLNRHIKLEFRYGHFAWVMNTHTPQHWTSEWRQLGYGYEGYGGKVDDYTSLSEFKHLETVPYQNYYLAPLASYSGDLKLPDNLEASLDKAFNLNKSDWNKLYMAISWYGQNEYLWQESTSSAFIALVTALECLLEETDKSRCECCGQPIYTVTKRFREFLKRYVPFIDQYPKERDVIYTIRSNISHGRELLIQDLEPWGFLISAKKEEQDAIHRNLYFIVGIAIYNWLWNNPNK